MCRLVTSTLAAVIPAGCQWQEVKRDVPGGVTVCVGLGVPAVDVTKLPLERAIA